MRVIGIDPGVARTGYAIIEEDGSRLVTLAVGVVRTPPGSPHGLRLVQLQGDLGSIIAEQRPDAAAIEALFFSSNARTAMAVGQASGVALAAAAGAGLDVADYTPLEVKQSVVGVGSASKRQVQAMVASILHLSAPPRPADAADACALAICHLHRSRFARALRRAAT